MSETFTTQFTKLLEDCKPQEALKLFMFENSEVIQNAMSEIVHVAVSYLTEYNEQFKKELFECCTTILNTIAERYNPKETILEFLEHIECLNDDVRFHAIILGPLNICMLKMKKKNKVEAIEWCISTIKSYVEDLPVPYNDDDQNKINFRIMKVYDGIILFLKSIVDDMRIDSEFKKGTLLGDYLLSLIISLYGKPFCYLSKNIVETNGQYKLILDNLMTLVFCLSGDALYFLDIVSNRHKNIIAKRCNKESDEYSYSKKDIHNILFEISDNVSNLAYANFYFHIITDETYYEKVPQIYSPYYILKMCTYFYQILLCEERDILISNGLIFMEHVIKRVPPRSIGSEVLSLKIYPDLFKLIINIMIYCNNDTERKKTVHIFYEYIKIFDMEARYSILSYLYETSQHSGLMSFIIGILKSCIIECLDSTPRDPHFLGKNMETMLIKLCILQYGSSSDLVEISDEVITMLNLLRFLFIRDKHNETGIWNIINTIECNYLKPLREGIDLCRSHWRVKLKDLEQQKENYVKIHDYGEMKKADEEVTLIVGCEQLPVMPLPKKILFCYQAINGFRCLWTSRALLANQFENNNGKTDSQQCTHEENDEDYEKNIKIKILAASLKFVNDLGWSKQAISAGAESIGYPGVIHGLFPNGGAALVQHFYSICNRELNEILEKEAFAIQDDPSRPRKAPEQQVCDAVETRLKMVIPYKKNWPQAMAIMTLPPNVPIALANLLTLVDDICYYAGDRSVDINWYTRRVMLASIYKGTELYMLQDSSEDHKKTWLFLDRRIKDTLQIHRILSSSVAKPSADEALSRTSETAAAVFVTARNILGLNWNR